MSIYKGKALDTIGDYGCYSFYETKNLFIGEGRALLIKNPLDAERAEIVREKGMNRNKFFRGEIDKYIWVVLGSSYLPSGLSVFFLRRYKRSRKQKTMMARYVVGVGITSC